MGIEGTTSEELAISYSEAVFKETFKNAITGIKINDNINNFRYVDVGQ